ncbi:MAG TPA: glycosyl hydrolase, partial [Prolixibacteraceae bacterium]|nr:glycosyl hydrolase [Prolixibacteraceae bacterium]
MGKYVFYVFSALLLVGCAQDRMKQQQAVSYSAEGKSVEVYTTADSSDLRLTPTGTLSFTPAQQPKETEICVFVNPSVTFQEFLGIGGAITDASAEVFARLSLEKQKEFLTAYYDREKGIGYSLMRTTIHSSDFS